MLGGSFPLAPSLLGSEGEGVEEKRGAVGTEGSVILQQGLGRESTFFESGTMVKVGGSGVGVPRFRYGFRLLLKFSGPRL